MIGDIVTIMSKELKEMFIQRPGLRGGWMGLLVFLGAFGVLLPYQSGAEWVDNFMLQIYWLWVPFLMVSTVVADSFAGERERNTLETLLASRLSDRAILFGKLASAVAYGWLITLAGIVLGLVTVNVTAGSGKLLMFEPVMGIGLIFMTFLVALLAAGIGVLISLRASTVRQAQQTMGMIGFLPFVPLLLLPLLGTDVQFSILTWVQGLNFAQIVLGIIGVLLILDALLVAAAMARFQRAKLILD